MRTSAPRLAAGLLAAGVLLSGCGGSPEPSPLPKPSKSSSPSPSATPTPPVMPEAAKATNDAAVRAFAEHFISIINYTASSGDRQAIDAISMPACESCESIAARASETYKQGGYIRGDGWSIRRSQVVPDQPRRRIYVELTIDQAPETVLSRKGGTPKRFPGGQHNFNLVVTRQGGTWKVARLDLVT